METATRSSHLLDERRAVVNATVSLSIERLEAMADAEVDPKRQELLRWALRKRQRAIKAQCAREEAYADALDKLALPMAGATVAVGPWLAAQIDAPVWQQLAVPTMFVVGAFLWVVLRYWSAYMLKTSRVRAALLGKVD